MGEPDNKEADAGRKIIFSYGFVKDSDMDTKEVFLNKHQFHSYIN